MSTLRYVRFMVVMVLSCRVLVQAAAGGSVDEVNALDRLVLQGRRQVRQIDVELSFANCRGADCREGRTANGTIRYYWDGADRRMDRTRSEPNYAMPIRDLVVQGGETNLTWSDKLSNSGGHLSVMLSHGKVAKEANATKKLPNVLLVGFAPDSFSNYVYYNLESFIGNKGRTEVTLEIDPANPDVKVVRYLSDNGARVSYKVDMLKGNTPIFLSVDTNSEGKRYLSEVESTLAQDSSSGIWFPSDVHFRQVSADLLDARQDLTVKVHSINRPIDPSVFTLATMGVPEGTTVTQFPSSPGDTGRYFWDGSEIARRDNLGRVVSTKQESQGRPLVWSILLASGVILTAVAGGVLWRNFRRNL